MVRPKQVWSTDITYRRLARGCASLVASIDWYARRVLSWRISHRMESVFCVECLEEAARTHGRPEMFTSDQGSQCTGVLKRDGVGISRDGRGGAFDHLFVERLWRSVTHEDVYRTGYAAMGALMIGLAQYIVCYNGERPHQSLGQQTPGVVYRTARGGGAVSVDTFGGAVAQPPAPRRVTGVSATADARSEATATTDATATPGQRRPAASAVECAA